MSDQLLVDRILEKLQDLTSASFSTFLIVHLASPIAASFVSSSRSESIASNIQLASRVYYQDSRFRESLIVYFSLSSHVLIGIIRRIRRVRRQRRLRLRLERSARLAEDGLKLGDEEDDGLALEESLRGRGGRPVYIPKQSIFERLSSFLPRTFHSICAYISIPFLIDHIYSHRLDPRLDEISYQYVSYLLNNHQPILSIIKYSVLVTTVSFHSIFGISYLASKYLSNNRKLRDEDGGSDGRRRKFVSISSVERSRLVQLTWLGVIGSVGLGLKKISKNSVPIWLIKRYDLISR